MSARSRFGTDKKLILLVYQVVSLLLNCALVQALTVVGEPLQHSPGATKALYAAFKLGNETFEVVISTLNARTHQACS